MISRISKRSIERLIFTANCGKDLGIFKENPTLQ